MTGVQTCALPIFIQCVIWGKPAEVLAKYTQKGSLIAVNGELQSRSYDDQQGQIGRASCRERV